MMRHTSPSRDTEGIASDCHEFSATQETAKEKMRGRTKWFRPAPQLN
jgi:hypothetical protein